jgi:hypothetical protein
VIIERELYLYNDVVEEEKRKEGGIGIFLLTPLPPDGLERLGEEDAPQIVDSVVSEHFSSDESPEVSRLKFTALGNAKDREDLFPNLLSKRAVPHNMDGVFVRQVAVRTMTLLRTGVRKVLKLVASGKAVSEGAVEDVPSLVG